MLFNIVLASAICQHESAIGIHNDPSVLNVPHTSHPIPPYWVVTEHWI